MCDVRAAITRPKPCSITGPFSGVQPTIVQAIDLPNCQHLRDLRSFFCIILGMKVARYPGFAIGDIVRHTTIGSGTSSL